MKFLTIDVETTTENKGNCFNPNNKLVSLHWYNGDAVFGRQPTPESLSDLQREIDKADVIVGFNFKFDYHWLRKAGICLDNKRIWDVQIAEYVLRFQRESYLSLQDVCESYGIKGKEDAVAAYWKQGIDTDQIPWDILESYGNQDSIATHNCALNQLSVSNERQKRLIFYKGYDLHVLEEMEWNGLYYDEKLCSERAEECQRKIDEINTFLSSIYPNIPINFSSNQQLSAFLYGGIIKEEGKEHIGFFKTGVKAGQPKYRNVEFEHILPRLVKPLPKSEMAKEGVYATDEGTLRKLKGKAAEKFVTPLLELAKYEKLLQTYYRGIPAINHEYKWRNQTIHGTLNQTTTRTGRISATKPNQQNFAGDCQDIFITRYD